MTAKEAIVSTLSDSDRPLAVFEFGLMGVAQTSISARLRELARDGIVQSVRVPGKRYTAWTLAPKDLVLPLNSQPGVI